MQLLTKRFELFNNYLVEKPTAYNSKLFKPNSARKFDGFKYN